MIKTRSDDGRDLDRAIFVRDNENAKMMQASNDFAVDDRCRLLRQRNMMIQSFVRLMLWRECS